MDAQSSILSQPQRLFITTSAIVDFHRLLFFDQPTIAGVLRSFVKRNVEIRGSFVRTSDFSMVEPDLAEFCIGLDSFINADAGAVPGFLLWSLCTIHPFLDGNGRLGRALAVMVIDGSFPTRNWLEDFDRTVFKNYRGYLSQLRSVDAANDDDRNVAFHRLTNFLLSLRSLHP